MNTKSNVDKHGLGRLDSWFIDTYLRNDGETLDEVKVRIVAESGKNSKNFQNNAFKPKTQTKL